MSKVTASGLSGMKAAEAELAKQDRKEALDASFLPEGHPLRMAAEQQAQLSEEHGIDLPPGHPMLEVLEVAKRRYEKKEQLEEELLEREEEEEDEKVEVRRARRVDKRKVALEQRDKEEEGDRERSDAIRDVNSALAEVVASVERAQETMEGHREILERHRYTSRMTDRIGRILNAAGKGMSDMKLSSVRSSNDG